MQPSTGLPDGTPVARVSPYTDAAHLAASSSISIIEALGLTSTRYVPCMSAFLCPRFCTSLHTSSQCDLRLRQQEGVQPLFKTCAGCLDGGIPLPV